MERAYIRNLKKRLLEEKRESLVQLNQFDSQLNLSEQDSISELSSYDNHPADIGTEVFERTKDFALRADVKAKIARIDDALARIESGTYGRCRNCGREISISRLRAVPHTDLCDICKDTNSSLGSSQTETVSHPSIQDFNNEGTDKTFFDGEDTWQAVARFNEHAGDSGAGAYYGPGELDSEDRGLVEDVEGLPYFKGINGVVYRDYKNIASDENVDDA